MKYSPSGSMRSSTSFQNLNTIHNSTAAVSRSNSATSPNTTFAQCPISPVYKISSSMYGKARGSHLTIASDGILPPSSSSSSQSPHQQFPTATVIFRFNEAVSKHRNLIALNEPLYDSWRSYTWIEYHDEVMSFARALIHLQFGWQESVMIASNSSPRAFFATLGSIAVGGIATHVRMDHREEQYLEMALKCNTTVFVVENLSMLPVIFKIARTISKTAQVRGIVVLNNSIEEDHYTDVPVYNFDHFQALGYDKTQHVEARIASLNPLECCCLVYGYSSTGTLQGLMFSHDNLQFTAHRLAKGIEYISHSDYLVGYLPLFHIESQILEIYLPLFCGCAIYFIYQKRDSLGNSLKKIKPTLFFATPSTWELMEMKLFQEKSNITPVRKMFYIWAKEKAKSNSRRLQYGSVSSRSLGHVIANSLVLKHIKKLLGLDKCRACFAILAPMNLQTLESFNAADIPIYQMYGKQECTGFATVNSPRCWMFGSFGRTLGGTQLHINSVSSEVLYRGRHVFLGYLKDQQATAQVVDHERWLYSGHLGHLNPDGFLLITEQLSNFIVLSTGDSIPPVPFEEKLMVDIPELARALIVGEYRSFLSVLFILNTFENKGKIELAENVLRKSAGIGSKADTVKSIISCPFWAVHFDEALERLNATTQLASHRVRKWLVLPHDFTVEDGEIDAVSREPRRAFIQRKYRVVIDSLYS